MISHIVQEPERDQAKPRGRKGAGRKRDGMGKRFPSPAQLRLENDALRSTIKSLLSANGEAAFITDADGIILAANDVATERAPHFGQLVGRSVYEVLFPECAAERKARVNKVLATGAPLIFEDCRGERWVQSSIYPVLGSRREAVGLAVYETDITRLRCSEERVRTARLEKEILLREIHHRVKNNLQIVHSLLSLQIKRSGHNEITQILKECQNRIQSIALIHQRLYRSQNLVRLDMGAYLESLTQDIKRAYGADERAIEIAVSTDGLNLDPDTAIPCGLIVNELISNSLKHAFSGGSEGRVAVSLEQKGTHAVLAVSDNGIGLTPAPDFHQVPSLGLQLVAVLARQLNGTLSVHGTPGLTVSIVFPVSSNVPAPRGEPG